MSPNPQNSEGDYVCAGLSLVSSTPQVLTKHEQLVPSQNASPILALPAFKPTTLGACDIADCTSCAGVFMSWCCVEDTWCWSHPAFYFVWARVSARTAFKLQEMLLLLSPLTAAAMGLQTQTPLLPWFTGFG